MARKRQSRGAKPELVRRDGALCAAFLNTGSRRRRGLDTLADIVAWAVRCGAVSAGEAQRIEHATGEEAAAELVRRAAELRALLGRVLAALADGGKPAAADLEVLNAELKTARAARRLVAAGAGGYRWGWDPDAGRRRERLLWPVLLSVAELLTSKYRRQVRRCAGEGCDLLFVDKSPGAGRRWCTMKSCGARVKSRRHYRRTVKPRREEVNARALTAMQEAAAAYQAAHPEPPAAAAEEED